MYDVTKIAIHAVALMTVLVFVCLNEIPLLRL